MSHYEVREDIINRIAKALSIPQSDISFRTDGGYKSLFNIQGRDDIVVRFNTNAELLPQVYESNVSAAYHPLRKAIKVERIASDPNLDIAEKALPIQEFINLLIERGMLSRFTEFNSIFENYVFQNFPDLVEPLRIEDDMGIVGYREDGKVNYYIVLLDLSWLVEQEWAGWRRHSTWPKSAPLEIFETDNILELLLGDGLNNIIHPPLEST